MKGISTTSPQRIRRHQANTSKSKVAHKFSKTKRFSNPNPECKEAFYSYHSQQQSSRKSGIGFGKRSDFTKPLTCSPGSNKYMHKSFVEESKGKGKGKTFGLSREKMPNHSYFIPQLHKFPGPAQYDNSIPNKMKISHSMRLRTKDFVGDRLSYKQVPGPGEYSHIQLLPNGGRFRLSKFNDAKFAKINPKSARFREKGEETPGPFSYGTIDNFSQKGKYILSKRKGLGQRSFDLQKRETFTDIAKRKKFFNPGPGAYEKPSDFGTYGDHSYNKTLRQTIN